MEFPLYLVIHSSSSAICDEPSCYFLSADFTGRTRTVFLDLKVTISQEQLISQCSSERFQGTLTIFQRLNIVIKLIAKERETNYIGNSNLLIQFAFPYKIVESPNHWSRIHDSLIHWIIESWISNSRFTDSLYSRDLHVPMFRGS